MSEAHHDPNQSHDSHLAEVIPIRTPEVVPDIVDNYLPITCRQYDEDKAGLQELFSDKVYGDKVLRAENVSRPQVIIDTVFSTLGIGPDVDQLRRANKTTDVAEADMELLRSQIATLEHSPLVLPKRQRNELQTKAAQLRRVEAQLESNLPRLLHDNTRRNQLAIAQSNAQEFLQTQRESSRQHQSEYAGNVSFGDLLFDIHAHATEHYGDTDVIRALDVLRSGPLKPYPDAMIIAQRTIITMLFLRDFPVDDDPDVLDLGY